MITTFTIKVLSALINAPRLCEYNLSTLQCACLPDCVPVIPHGLVSHPLPRTSRDSLPHCSSAVSSQYASCHRDVCCAFYRVHCVKCFWKGTKLIVSAGSLMYLGSVIILWKNMGTKWCVLFAMMLLPSWKNTTLKDIKRRNTLLLLINLMDLNVLRGQKNYVQK
jgi:hypothetical protein